MSTHSLPRSPSGGSGRRPAGWSHDRSAEPALDSPLDAAAPRHDPAAAYRSAVRLGWALALTALASAATTFVGGDRLLHGPAVMNGSARGTALVMAMVAVPTLVAALLLDRRTDRAALVWLGACGYLLYNAVMMVFGTPFNQAFLLYVATLGLALAATGTRLAALDGGRLSRVLGRGLPARPRRWVAGFIGFVAAANALVWLKVVVPALDEPYPPRFLAGTGLTVFPTHVQDLAFWLPLAGLVAWWLWHGRPWGVPLAAAFLVYWLLEAIGVAVDQWFGSAADPTSQVATRGGAYLFAALAVITVVPVVTLLRPRRQPLPAPQPEPQRW